MSWLLTPSCLYLLIQRQSVGVSVYLLIIYLLHTNSRSVTDVMKQRKCYIEIVVIYGRRHDVRKFTSRMHSGATQNINTFGRRFVLVYLLFTCLHIMRR